LADLLWKLAAAFGAAVILALLSRRYALRAGDRLTAPDGSPGIRKFLVSLGLSLLRLIPPVVMLLVVFVGLTLLLPHPLGAAAALAAAWAYFVRTALLAVSRIFFAPLRPSVRFLPLKDETAAYWNVWMRRLTGLGVYGYYFVRIVEILGASEGLTRGLFEIYAAILVIQVITLVLQQRREVRARLASDAGSGGEGGGTLRNVKRFLAVYGHAITVVYLIVGYGLWLLDYPDALGLMVRATLYTALLIALCVILRRFLAFILRRLFRVPPRLAARFPDLEGRANRYVRVTNRVVFSLLYLLTALLIIEAWEVRLFDFLFSDFGLFVMKRLFAIGVALLIAFVVLEGGDFAAKALLQPRTGPDGETVEPPARLKTLVPLGRATVKVAVIGIAILVVMEQIGINITPILAGVGVLGLAVGFGAQSLVKDIISGLFIILEDSMSVGDIVVLQGTAGMVENLSLRTIRIRDLAGNVHVIPHSSVDRVTNMTKDFSRYVMDVGVSYREDTDEVVEILKEIGAGMQADPEYGPDILRPIEIMGVDRFEDSAVVVRARFWTKPIKQWHVGREFNRRMKKVFDERGIEIPFPHRTVYFGDPKEGTPPPLYLEQVSRAFEDKGERGASGEKRTDRSSEKSGTPYPPLGDEDSDE
jgi:small conductance mechanosensitive channel